jgi:hypothetical protein
VRVRRNSQDRARGQRSALGHLRVRRRLRVTLAANLEAPACINIIPNLYIDMPDGPDPNVQGRLSVYFRF